MVGPDRMEVAKEIAQAVASQFCAASPDAEGRSWIRCHDLTIAPTTVYRTALTLWEAGEGSIETLESLGEAITDLLRALREAARQWQDRGHSGGLDG